MKNAILAASLLLPVAFAQAQQKEGRVLYERTTQMRVRFSGADQIQQMLPRSRKDKLEVLFANDRSLRRAVPEDAPEEEPAAGGMQIRTMVAGADDITFHNLATGIVTEQREFAAKKYLVSDTVRKLNWKLTGEMKTILNYACQKAISQRIGSRTTMSMENGQMQRQVVADTANIVVWFTSAIPVSAGPDYQGQLPGLILEIEVNNGNIVYKALEVSPKVELTAIKEPKSGKRMSPEEFNKERDKTLEEMQRNSGGRGRMIRIDN